MSNVSTFSVLIQTDTTLYQNEKWNTLNECIPSTPLSRLIKKKNTPLTSLPNEKLEHEIISLKLPLFHQ